MTVPDPDFLGERDGLVVRFDPRRGYARLSNPMSEEEARRLYAGAFWSEKGDEQEVRRSTADWWSLHYTDWLRMVEDAFLNENGRRPTTLMDIGCGFGYFAREALHMGLTVDAVDPNPDAVLEAYRVLAVYRATTVREVYTSHRREVVSARGIDWSLRCTTFDADPVDGGTVDVVSALWVAEHLHDPEAFLQRAHDHLGEGGVLLIAVPSDFSPAQIRANPVAARPFWWIDRTHLNYWTPVTLANLLGRSGFRVVGHTTMYPMERCIVPGGQDYTNDPKLGATLHERVRAFDSELNGRAGHYRTLAQLGSGREIVYVAVKHRTQTKETP